MAVTVFALTAALAAPAAAVPPSVDPTDDRVTRQHYVRHDGGTDAAIELCNSTAPADYGNNTVNNEPFSVVSPTNPNPYPKYSKTTAVPITQRLVGMVVARNA